ncbi:MAG TPA: hypothetical protein VFR24_27220 [Candidatus Angelobacter sp.]|nr:hypothetical protein [Candidatus Angelobacter sp.]
MSGDNLSPEGLTALIEERKSKFDIIRSDPITLLLDLDTEAALAQYERVLPIVKAEFSINYIEKWKSKSGNTHIAITLSDPFPFEERLALQAALGSDGVREALSLKCLLNKCTEPSILFRPFGAEITKEIIRGS